MVVVTLLLFGLYLAAMPPTFDVADSGEFVTQAVTLGIAHPPGYPLYGLLGRWFTLVPFGSPAYRVNLLSAACGAAAAALAGMVARGWSGTRWVGPITTVMAGTAPMTVWAATYAKPYAPAAALLMGIVWLLTAGPSPSSPTVSGGRLYAVGLLLGLAVVAHPMMLGAAVVIMLVAPGWRQRSAGFLMMTALGLAVSLVSAVRAAHHPLLNWEEADTLGRFLRLVTRAGFRSLEAGHGFVAADKIPFLTAFAGRMTTQFTLAGILLGGYGVWTLARNGDRSRRAAILSGALWATLGPGVLLALQFSPDEGTLRIVAQYALPATLLLAVWIGFAAGRAKRGRRLYAAGLLLLAGWGLIRARTEQWNRHKYLAWDYGVNILRTLGRDQSVWVAGDTPVFSLWALQQTERRRPDVRVFGLAVSELHEEIQGQFRKSAASPLYTLGRLEMKDGRMDGRPVTPLGLLNRIETAGSPPARQDAAELVAARYVARDLWARRESPDFLDREVVRTYAAGEALAGFRHARDQRDAAARRSFMRAAMLDSQVGDTAYNVGASAWRMGEYPAARRGFLRALRADPNSARALAGLRACERKMATPAGGARGDGGTP